MMDFLTTKEFAERIGTTQGRVNQLITAGTINAEMKGKTYLIHVSQIEKAENRTLKKAGRPRKFKQINEIK